MHRRETNIPEDGLSRIVFRTGFIPAVEIFTTLLLLKTTICNLKIKIFYFVYSKVSYNFHAFCVYINLHLMTSLAIEQSSCDDRNLPILCDVRWYISHHNRFAITLITTYISHNRINIRVKSVRTISINVGILFLNEPLSRGGFNLYDSILIYRIRYICFCAVRN